PSTDSSRKPKGGRASFAYAPTAVSVSNRISRRTGTRRPSRAWRRNAARSGMSIGAGMSSSRGNVSIIVAVDTGGTFTDAVAVADGSLRIAKVPSTPEDPARAVHAALEALGAGSDAALLVHGSTVATNTLLERSGARAVLITNRGFEDVIEIGRQDRPQLYALHGTRPPPL